MNKKGFTLVELLAVIVILAVILTIAVPNMFKIINKSKEDTYNNQVTMIIDAAKKYVVTEEVTVAVSPGTCINLSAIVTAGYLEKTPKNPKTGVDMAGSVTAIKDGTTGNYTYTYSDTACTP